LNYKKPHEWIWHEGPLPDVNDAPDNVHIIVWSEWNVTQEIEILYAKPKEKYYKKSWQGSPILSVHKCVKYWAVIEGPEFEEWAIKEIIE
jgi:hypothetical protein